MSCCRYASLTQSMRENLGIIVQYKVKIRLVIAGALGGELIAELPFTLTHPKPIESPIPGNFHTLPAGIAGLAEGGDSEQAQLEADIDLIQFDSFDDEKETDVVRGGNGLGDEDDLVFEDFARLRVRGSESEPTKPNVTPPITGNSPPSIPT